MENITASVTRLRTYLHERELEKERVAAVEHAIDVMIAQVNEYVTAKEQAAKEIEHHHHGDK